MVVVIWCSTAASRETPVLLVALFFFPGVGVVDDQVREWGLACRLYGGGQAVDGLCLPVKGLVAVSLHVVVSVISWASRG